jgi:hypothetical protein
VSGDVAGASDDHEGSCSVPASGGEDLVYTWTAPADGFYRFDTFGSALDTVVYVYAGTCLGPERACNDDSGGDYQSQVSVALAAGDVVQIVVDAFGAASTGGFDLNVGMVDCPDGALASAVGPGVASGDTSGAGDDAQGSCGDAGGEDRWFTWTAPAAGTYTFDTIPSDFDTVLFVWDGPCSGGPELGCNDDGANVPVAESELTLDLAAGQTVTIVVDGLDDFEAGTFTLNVTGP